MTSKAILLGVLSLSFVASSFADSTYTECGKLSEAYPGTSSNDAWVLEVNPQLSEDLTTQNPVLASELNPIASDCNNQVCLELVSEQHGFAASPVQLIVGIASVSNGQ